VSRANYAGKKAGTLRVRLSRSIGPGDVFLGSETTWNAKRVKKNIYYPFQEVMYILALQFAVEFHATTEYAGDVLPGGVMRVVTFKFVKFKSSELVAAL
jgi:hypothetical protein